MIKIVLGEKKNVNRKAMVSKGVEARNVTVYYVLESLDLQYSISTYEIVDEPTDKTLEIEGKHYKAISFENTKYFSTIQNAIEGYLKMRMLKPDKDITSIKQLYGEMLELKKESERLYGLVK